MDIYTEDVHAISPDVKFILFDAGFDGSFQKQKYRAGEYVFGKGSTMVAHATSVNGLQDGWPDEMIGLLGLGVRVGNWAKQINTMETHLIGDPTFYFSSDKRFDYNKLISYAWQDEKHRSSCLNRTSLTCSVWPLLIFQINAIRIFQVRWPENILFCPRLK